LSFFGKEKKKPSGKFKPKIIGSIIGATMFLIIGINSAITVISGKGEVTEHTGIQGDFVVMIFGFGFAVGFAYWGIANFLERKKVKADRQRKKDEGRSSKHKKRSKEK